MNGSRNQLGRYVVCRAGELPAGQRKIVEVAGRSIGVFNVNGEYYALRNRCPHRSAPLCLGTITGLVQSPGPHQYEVAREGTILRCPWHGWEFDITNGRSIFNPNKMRVKSYEVTIEPDDEDPSVETYPVSVESGVLILHV